jgi:hypothetical protein
MNRYDPDRIAALAAGQLRPDEAAVAEREVAADPRAAAELAAQRLALAALRRAPLPLLSAEERTELRSRVAAALNLEESAVARVVSTKRRVPWRPIAVAAAALAVIAAVVPLAGLLSVGGDQAAMTTAAEATLAARNGAQEPAAATTVPPGALGDYADDGDLTAGMLGIEGLGAEAAQAVERLLADPAALIAAADEGLTTCADEAADLLGGAGRASAAPVPLASGEAVAWFVSPGGAAVESLAIFDPADCTLLAASPDLQL